MRAQVTALAASLALGMTANKEAHARVRTALRSDISALTQRVSADNASLNHNNSWILGFLQGTAASGEQVFSFYSVLLS
jgi:hypothetical protein